MIDILKSACAEDPALSAFGFTLLGTFIGIFLGHRFNLWRDRRKEFNDAMQPIRVWILNEMRHTNCPRPTLAEHDAFTQRLNRFRRRGFDDAWEKYLKAYGEAFRQDKNTGTTHFAKSAELQVALEQMLKYCQFG